MGGPKEKASKAEKTPHTDNVNGMNLERSTLRPVVAMLNVCKDIRVCDRKRFGKEMFDRISVKDNVHTPDEEELEWLPNKEQVRQTFRDLRESYGYWFDDYKQVIKKAFQVACSYNAPKYKDTLFTVEYPGKTTIERCVSAEKLPIHIRWIDDIDRYNKDQIRNWYPLDLLVKHLEAILDLFNEKHGQVWDEARKGNATDTPTGKGKR